MQNLSKEQIKEKLELMASYEEKFKRTGHWTPEEREVVIREMPLVLELAKKAEQLKYNKSFHKFSKELIGWPDYYDPLHKTVCDFIQDNIETKMCLLLLPRGTFKSSIVTTGFPLWKISKDPATRGMIANATYPMATQFLGQVKDGLAKNEEFRRIYGDYSTNAPIWREDAFAISADSSWKSKEPTVSALGVGSNYTGKHFDWAILDDLVNRDNIRTIDRIEGVKDFYKDILDLVDPSKAGHKRVIVIGTTWHQSDLYSWIMDPENGLRDEFAILRLPAYGTFDVNNKFVGEWGKDDLLFPTRLTWNVMAGLKKSQGNSHFSAQYLLDPVPPEDAKFKNFKFYEPTDIKGLRLNKFMSVDPALSEKKEADYSAIVVVGVDAENKWYILDMWRDKVDPHGLIDQIFYMDAMHMPRTVAIESVAFQRVIQFFLEDEMKARKHKFDITKLTHSALSKNDRILGLQPKYEQGQVYHPKYPRGHRLFKMEKYLRDELERFPRAKNDDLSDALASILEVSYPAKKHKRGRSYGTRTSYPSSSGGW